ncbi:MAG TPA: ThiF family adenylyltransferase [Burkholderiales bacterium]|nr:ThiF family adenylyltransferase [Burkholderiales bacterium]
MIGPGRKLVQAYLSQRGFKRAAPRAAGATAFRGTLPCRGHLVPIQLEIEDWNFVAYPRIFVLQRPPILDGYRPHIGLGQQLCYLSKGEEYLDVYDPASMIKNCLEQAESVLHDISGNTNKIDRAGEFLVNWRPEEAALIADDVASVTTKSDFFGLTVISPPKKQFACLLIGKDPSQLSTQLQSIGYHGPKQYLKNCLVLRIEVPPCFDPDHWPPATFADLLHWLKKLDEKAYKTLVRHLESDWILRHEFSSVLFVSPVGRFGCTFTFALPKNLSEKYFLRHPADLRQRIFKTASTIKIVRFGCMEITPEFIHGRNQGKEGTLAGLKITLVGCGTIGGYLATYLARLGAGANGGELVLIDSDELSPSNLGRHVLSMKHLFSPKAEALAEHLREEFPHLKVTPRPVDVLSVGKLFECGLVIDATGEEAVSTVINQRHVNRRDRGSPPVLYAWVEGQGYAVRTLLVDSAKAMCYQCQYIRSGGERRERIPILRDPSADHKRQLADCENFTPFPVSASVNAAALALEAVMDWRRKKTGNRFRARRLSEQHTENRRDSSPDRLDSCVACGS